MHGSVSAMLASLASSVYPGGVQLLSWLKSKLVCSLYWLNILAKLLIVWHRAVLFYDEGEYTELNPGAVSSPDAGSVGVF